jgi:hypothetical protein
VPQKPALAPTPDPATAHHRWGRPTAAPVRRRTGGSTPPTRRRTGPAPPHHRVRTPRRAHRVAGPASALAGRAWAHTTDAARRTRAPSQTPRPPRAPPGTPTPARSGTATTPTCRPPARRARPAPRYAPPAGPPATGQASRTRYAGPATPGGTASRSAPRCPACRGLRGHRPTAKLNRTLRSVNVAGWPRRRGRRSPRTPRGWGLPTVPIPIACRSKQCVQPLPVCGVESTAGSLPFECDP